MTTYRTDKPAVGRMVIVWWWGEDEVVAAWDGLWWRDEAGLKLRGPVTHWRER